MDNDNPTSEEMQRYEERRMFDLFLEYVVLPVAASTIEHREPPEPDILCQLETGETIAFELGELSDESYRRVENTMLQFRSSLWRIFSELPQAVRSALEERYRMCRIDVAFDPEVSLRRQAPAIEALYRWLQSREKIIGFLDAAALPREVATAIPNVRISEPAPHLWIEPSSRVGVSEPDLSVLAKKLRKPYETSHPIELLLHSTWPLSEKWVAHYSGVIREAVSSGPFRRVWVFSPTERASETVHPLRFVFPARD